MRRLVLGAMVALAMLSSCRQCTLKGVVGTLSFVLPDAEATALTAGSSTLETCVDNTCWSDSLDEAGTGQRTTFTVSSRELLTDRLKPTGGPNGESAFVEAGPDSDVSITVTRDGGTVFTRTWTDAEFVRTEPNGEGCGEVYLLKSSLTF